jgi:hypothetical protein
MAWCDDKYGIVTRSNKIKCYKSGHSWEQKLWQLNEQKGSVRVATYSLDADLAIRLFHRCQKRVWILCNEMFDSDARRLKTALPQIGIACCKGMHAKFVLVEPDTVYIGSMNLVKVRMHDTVLELHSRDMLEFYADWFYERWMEPSCRQVSGAHTANPYLKFAHETSQHKQKARFPKRQPRRRYYY